MFTVSHSSSDFESVHFHDEIAESQRATREQMLIEQLDASHPDVIAAHEANANPTSEDLINLLLWVRKALVEQLPTDGNMAIIRLISVAREIESQLSPIVAA